MKRRKGIVSKPFRRRDRSGASVQLVAEAISSGLVSERELQEFRILQSRSALSHIRDYFLERVLPVNGVLDGFQRTLLEAYCSVIDVRSVCFYETLLKSQKLEITERRRVLRAIYFSTTSKPKYYPKCLSVFRNYWHSDLREEIRELLLLGWYCFVKDPSDLSSITENWDRKGRSKS
jgi:hypothetical protein